MLSPEQAHECYLQLTNIRAQLETGVPESQIEPLETEERGLQNMLREAGYDPDDEPESIWPENRQQTRKTPEVPGYEIYAYDKDNGRLDLLLDMRGYTVYNKTLPEHILKTLAALVKSEQLKAPDGQPYDWLELHYNEQRVAVA